MIERRAIHASTLSLLVLLASSALSGCLGFGHKKSQPADAGSLAPDKVLFDRATKDIQSGKFTVGRLTLQTLINTYPDSEYLAKAKLAIADSYYKEGGTSGLTQSVDEYKNFIIFFPFLDEAPYAQMQVAMAHYRMMEKPDRDRTQARFAEEEFQTFLLKYGQSPLLSQAEQHLREVQEVLAEGDYRIARFYYLRMAYRASAARLLELTDRYPLYSQADKANWMLADIYQRNEHTDLAAKYFARIVRDYPLSPMVPEAKKRLAALGYPVPQADPGALARMQKEQQTPRQRAGLVRRSTGFLRQGPDVRTAARIGAPNLNPPGEGASPTEVLQPQGGAGSMNVSGSASTGSGGSVPVETVPAGSAPPTAAEGGAADTKGNSPPGVTATAGAANPSAGGGTGTAPCPPNSPGAQPAANGASPANAPCAADPKAAQQGASGAADGSSGRTVNKKDSSSKSKESTSKKKKGLRKLIPW